MLGQWEPKRTGVNTGVIRRHGGIAKTGTTSVDRAITKTERLPSSPEGSIGIDKVTNEDQKTLKEGRVPQSGPENLPHESLELVRLLASGTGIDANVLSNVVQERDSNSSKRGGEMETLEQKMKA